MKTPRIAIIGAGAAGCFASIEVKRQLPDAQVTVYEGGRRPLAKVAVTGGGRCNLTNSFRGVKSVEQVYPRGGKLMKRLLKSFSHEDVCQWFEREGVRLVTQADECVFPRSQDAQEIVHTLLRLMEREGVCLLTGHRVKGLSATDDGYRIDFTDGALAAADADLVVVTTGGHPTAEGFAMLSGLQIDIERPVPSLFSLCLPGDDLTLLTGTVVDDAMVSIPGTKLRDQGPLLITHWGLSGPALLKLSSHAARLLHERNYQTDLSINWCGSRKQAEVEETLAEMQVTQSRKLVANTHPSWLNTRLWQHLLTRAQMSPSLRWAEVQKKQWNRLINTLTADVHHAEGKCRFKEEFVTCGGVSLSALNPSTLECRHHAGLYFAGEVTDVDAVTGGFNLQAAWTMAHTVAEAIGRKVHLS